MRLLFHFNTFDTSKSIIFILFYFSKFDPNADHKRRTDSFELRHRIAQVGSYTIIRPT